LWVYGLLQGRSKGSPARVNRTELTFTAIRFRMEAPSLDLPPSLKALFSHFISLLSQWTLLFYTLDKKDWGCSGKDHLWIQLLLDPEKVGKQNTKPNLSQASHLNFENVNDSMKLKTFANEIFRKFRATVCSIHVL
jgi:hypothetical protein